MQLNTILKKVHSMSFFYSYYVLFQDSANQVSANRDWTYLWTDSWLPIVLTVWRLVLTTRHSMQFNSVQWP